MVNLRRSVPVRARLWTAGCVFGLFLLPLLVMSKLKSVGAVSANTPNDLVLNGGGSSFGKYPRARIEIGGKSCALQANHHCSSDLTPVGHIAGASVGPVCSSIHVEIAAT